MPLGKRRQKQKTINKELLSSCLLKYTLVSLYPFCKGNKMGRKTFHRRTFYCPLPPSHHFYPYITQFKVHCNGNTAVLPGQMALLIILLIQFKENKVRVFRSTLPTKRLLWKSLVGGRIIEQLQCALTLYDFRTKGCWCITSCSRFVHGHISHNNLATYWY